MEDRNSLIAEATAELAAWLTVHALPSLPEIAAVRVGFSLDGFMAEGQLLHVVGRSSLVGLAAWAEHLGTTALLEHGYFDTYLKATITTHMAEGARLELWKHLDSRDWRALTTVTNHNFQHGPARFGAEVLRRAEAWRAER